MSLEPWENNLSPAETDAWEAELTDGVPDLTDSEKLEFLYSVAVKADKLMNEVGPQLVPMLEGIAKNPMLKMFLK